MNASFSNALCDEPKTPCCPPKYLITLGRLKYSFADSIPPLRIDFLYSSEMYGSIVSMESASVVEVLKLKGVHSSIVGLKDISPNAITPSIP